MISRATLFGTGLGVSLLFLGGLAAVPAEAVVAAKKPSDIRTVVATVPGSNACPGPAGSLRFETQQNPDGTTSPFTIPPKHVFVMTSVEFVFLGGTPSRMDGADLVVVSADGSSINSIGFARSLADTVGTSAATVPISDGAVVKSGAHLCFRINSVSGAILVRGFLTKDK